MRKGLTITLMTVAVAMLGIQAMAMAPVIGEVPSPVIGTDGGATGPNWFVYPDAFDLSKLATDDTVTISANIKWSYEIVGTANYNINGVAPINSTTENAITPGAKQVNNQVLNSELNPDSNTQTVTLRNVHLSPYVGDPIDPLPGGATGVVLAETQPVTLYASDGTTYSSKTVMFYTDKGGNDRMSPGGVKVKEWKWDGGYEGFAWSTFGGVTSGTSGATAICFTTGAAGDNYALFAGPLGDLPLVANQVYSIRAKVNGSNTVTGTVPFWDMYVDNYDGTNGLNAYGADIMFFDNEGGANAALSSPAPGKEFQLWWTPPAVGTPQWNDATNGAFNAANAGGTPAKNSARLVYRVLDVTSNGGIHAGSASGTICMTEAICERFDLTAMQTLQADVYSVTSFSAANSGGTGTIIVGSLLATNPTVDYAGGVLTITPTAATASVDIISIDPGRDLLYDLNNAASIADNYPVAWTDNTLLQITASISAPTQADADNPPDAILFGMDGPSNEVILSAFSTATKNGATNVTCGSPKTTAATFMSFFYTHNESDATLAQFHFLRPRLSILNNTGLTVGTNMGAVRIHNFKVNKVRF